MTRTEFEEAYKEVASRGQLWRPTAVQWDVICGFYISSELDSVCSGPDRHLAFARWVINNEKRVSDACSARYQRNSEKIAGLRSQIAALENRISNINAGLES